MDKRVIHWNNYEGQKTEAINFMKFQSWLQQAGAGDTITYITNASPKDISMFFFLQVKSAAFKAYCRGEVALFQKRVHPDHPGFDYVAVKLSFRARDFISALQQEPLEKIRERLRA